MARAAGKVTKKRRKRRIASAKRPRTKPTKHSKAPLLPGGAELARSERVALTASHLCVQRSRQSLFARLRGCEGFTRARLSSARGNPAIQDRGNVISVKEGADQLFHERGALGRKHPQLSRGGRDGVMCSAAACQGRRQGEQETTTVDARRGRTSARAAERQCDRHAIGWRKGLNR
jgi:hypothetical protein